MNGVPRSVLDARLGAKYKPSIEFDPTLSLIPKPVLGPRSILSSQTHLESTSLVLVYGIDVVCSVRTPSLAFDTLAEDFSYIGLILTGVALCVGIFVARRSADQKAVREAWK